MSGGREITLENTRCSGNYENQEDTTMQDQETTQQCPDCGQPVDWCDDTFKYSHLGENQGCFLDDRNVVVSDSSDDCGDEA